MSKRNEKPESHLCSTVTKRIRKADLLVIPNEILDQICRNLDRKTLKTFRLVCQRCNEISRVGIPLTIDKHVQIVCQPAGRNPTAALCSEFDFERNEPISIDHESVICRPLAALKNFLTRFRFSDSNGNDSKAINVRLSGNQNENDALLVILSDVPLHPDRVRFSGNLIGCGHLMPAITNLNGNGRLTEIFCEGQFPSWEAPIVDDSILLPDVTRLSIRPTRGTYEISFRGFKNFFRLGQRVNLLHCESVTLHYIEIIVAHWEALANDVFRYLDMTGSTTTKLTVSISGEALTLDKVARRVVLMFGCRLTRLCSKNYPLNALKENVLKWKATERSENLILKIILL